MTSLDHLEILARAADLVSANYVFPEVGEKISADLRAAAAAGRYAAAAGPEELAGLVTRDLQAANGDRHLRLVFHPDVIPDGKDAAAEQLMLTRAAESCAGVPRFEVLEGGVALVEFAPMLFPLKLSADSITAVMTLAAQARALVLDLRGNLGGDPYTAQYICSYLFDEPTHLNTQFWRDGEQGDQEEQSWTLPHVPGRRLGRDKPVAVLASGRTFSGGEELTYNLQQSGRAVVVGERTGGGAHPRNGWTLHPHLELTVPVGRSVNPVSGTSWEGVGITPDIDVPAPQALDRAVEELLARLG
ncbi:S41 family peptidase [Streptacidiphilus anmyonensis]|uniref:S41 family peptidase n=1 Tax=Streptacidiphilus anmyonensis TaxID=405782 RepID=UPI0005A9482D|nr:S41 family peptidase [Streptacidiphilus anmyonensis]